MSLRDDLAVILHEHQGPYQRVGEFDPKRIYGCQWGCDWTGPNTFGHAGHVADRLIAYLRDNLAQHGTELDLTQEWRVMDDGEQIASSPSWAAALNVLAIAELAGDTPEAQSRFVTDWSRADD